jgi:hypothetical protein
MKSWPNTKVLKDGDELIFLTADDVMTLRLFTDYLRTVYSHRDEKRRSVEDERVMFTLERILNQV